MALNINGNITQNQVGDYYIVAKSSATQCNWNRSTSYAIVGLYVFLIQLTKTTALITVLWRNT